MRLTFSALAPVLAALSLAACGSDTETSQETETTEPTMDAGDPAAGAQSPDAASADTPTEGARYVEVAGASDLYEIQSSELALEKAQSEEVRMFAQHMIEDHQMTTEQVTTAAEAAGIMPAPPQLTPMQQQMITELEGATGEAFDRTYLQQQRQAHQMALALHRNFAEQGDTEQLQQVASGAVPVVERHISELDGMNAGG
jgi:putative membrane protein